MKATRIITIGIIIGVIATVIWSLCRYRRQEGFQGAATPTLLNSQIPFKEVFLVAPVDTLQNLARSDDTSKGVGSVTEATAKCKALGAELATKAQLSRAFEVGATWCAAGWVSDSPKVLLPVATTGACSNAVVKCPRVPTGPPPTCIVEYEPSEVGGKAFPICYGVKPPTPAIDIVKFRPTQYGMLSEDDFNKISRGEVATTFPDTASLFPTVFTAAQVFYGYDKAFFSNAARPAYSTRAIRQWLVTNYGTVNSEIQTLVDRAENRPPDDAAGWIANPQSKTCEALKFILDGVKSKISELQTYFKDVKEGSREAILAKFENATLSARVASICRNETPQTSPACATLATLDGQIFYGTDSKGEFALMKTLENLNYQMKLRECELRKTFGALQLIQQTVGCAADPDATRLFGTNPYTAPNDACPEITGESLTPSIIPRVQSPDSPFNVGDAFGYNDVEILKRALQEISPYYDAPGFTDLINTVIRRLSVVLRIPNFNDYSSADDNFKAIRLAMNDIRALLPNIT